jgi:hypothetical protein
MKLCCQKTILHNYDFSQKYDPNSFYFEECGVCIRPLYFLLDYTLYEISKVVTPANDRHPEGFHWNTYRDFYQTSNEQ